MSHDSPKELRYGETGGYINTPAAFFPIVEWDKKIVPDNGGLRHNAGKPRFDLVPPEAMVALADHFRKGAEKYADRNWERGMDWGKCFASMERHAWSWMNGEDFDPETGSHHMVAVAWNALALYVYSVRGIGVDDRPKLQN